MLAAFRSVLCARARRAAACPRALHAPFGLAAALASVFLICAAPADASLRNCGFVHVPTRHTSAKVATRSGSERCGQARALVKAAYRAEGTRRYDGVDRNAGIYWRVRGWRCSTGLAETELFCRRGRRDVDASTRREDWRDL